MFFFEGGVITTGSRLNAEECVSTLGSTPVCRLYPVRKVNSAATTTNPNNRHPDYYPALQSISIAEGVTTDEFNYYIPAEFDSAFEYSFFGLVSNCNAFPIPLKVYKLMGSIEDKLSTWENLGPGNVLSLTGWDTTND